VDLVLAVLLDPDALSDSSRALKLGLALAFGRLRGTLRILLSHQPMSQQKLPLTLGLLLELLLAEREPMLDRGLGGLRHRPRLLCLRLEVLRRDGGSAR